MSTVYSTRFVVATGAGEHKWRVPGGYRAVVKCVAGQNNTGAVANMALIVNGVYIWVQPIPALQGYTASSLLIPYYAGEDVDFYLPQTAMSGCVSGFLFADTGTSPRAEELHTDIGPDLELPQCSSARLRTPSSRPL